jgi:hypothetical protein
VNDIGDYCRQVEAHLTRVNGGHLVRIVGPGFMLVRNWAEEGVPLSAVFRGIEQKAERHKAGAAKRPLRIEFCEADVREVYDAWRRAIGVSGAAVDAGDDAGAGPVGERGSGSARRVTTRDLDRAVDRLMATAGRLELPEPLRDEVNRVLEQVMQIRDAVKGSRGAAREGHLTALPELDRSMMTVAQAVIASDALTPIREDAERDLEPFRARLAPDAWDQAVQVTVARGVREHFGLPNLADIT